MDKWFTEEWQKVHDDARDRRLVMQGPSHHQGSRSLAEYKELWVSAFLLLSSILFYRRSSSLILFLCFSQLKTHPGMTCSDWQAFCMAHKKRAASDVSYDVNDPAEAYSNSSVGQRIVEYTAAARQKYGEEYDPGAHDIDTDIVMASFGGKKHGRLGVADGIIDSSGLRLSDVRARRADTDPPIRPRASVAQGRVGALEVEAQQLAQQLAEERTRRQEVEAQQATMAAKFEELTRFLATTGGLSLPPGLLGPVVPQLQTQAVLGTPVSMIAKSFDFRFK